MYFVSKGPGAIRGLTFEDALAFVGRTLNGIGRSRPESDVDIAIVHRLAAQAGLRSLPKVGCKPCNDGGKCRRHRQNAFAQAHSPPLPPTRSPPHDASSSAFQPRDLPLGLFRSQAET